MKIYRILDKQEYKCLLNNQSLFNPDQAWYNPAGMFYPANIDRHGKFFFFEIEDIYNFVYNYTNATPDDMILQLDIDRETALKYLSVANYAYFDPTKSDEQFTMEEIENMGNEGDNSYTYNHAIPELFIGHDIINDKIQKGEYSILSPETLLKYENRPKSYYEAHRNPKTVELARRLNEVRQLKQEVNENRFVLNNFDKFGEFEGGAVAPAQKERWLREKLECLEEKLKAATQETIDYFPEFCREHEKYMALVPIAESEPEQ